MLRFEAFKALTFDCYGTLIDWETGLLRVLRPWADRSDVSADDGQLLEAFGRNESPLQRASPTARYPEILRAVHGKLCDDFGVALSLADADALSRAVGDWPAFPDTPAALQALKRRFKLVIVSNVDRASFARTNEKLGVTFDAIVTAEDAGCYKPDPRVFERALETLAGLGVRKDEVLHVAESLYHDHAPAKSLGLATVWVHRRHGKPGWGATAAPPPGLTPDLTVKSMGELAALAGPQP